MRLWVILIAVLLLPKHAFSHARLLSSEPSDLSLAPAFPEQIEFVFNEPVLFVSANLVLPGGREVTLKAQEAASPRHSFSFPETSEAGTHFLSWRVISLDSHPIQGAVVFSVGEVTQAKKSSEAGVHEHGMLLLFSRLFLNFAAIGALGLLFWSRSKVMRRISLSPQFQRAGQWFARAGVLASIVHFAGFAIEAAGDVRTILSWSFFGVILSSGALWILATSVAGFLTLILSAERKSWFCFYPGALLVLSSLLFGGHLQTSENFIWSSVSLFLHLGGIVVWGGGLLALFHLTRPENDQEFLPYVFTFSMFARRAFPLVLLSGVALLALFTELQWNFSEDYERVMLIKGAFVSVISLLALTNRSYWLPRLKTGEAVPSGFRKTVFLEAVGFFLVLVMTAFLVQHAPPARRDTRVPQPVSLLLLAEEVPVKVQVQRSPGEGASLILEPVARGGAPLVEVSEVQIELALENHDMVPLTREAVQVVPGVYRYDGPELSHAGDWRLKVRLVISDFTEKTGETTFTIGSE